MTFDFRKTWNIGTLRCRFVFERKIRVGEEVFEVVAETKDAKINAAVLVLFFF